MAAPSGTVWGSIVGSYGRIGIYKSLSNANTETTVTVEVWFWSKYSVSDTNNTLYFDNLSSSGSASTSKGSVSISTTSDSGGWSDSNQKKLATYTYSYTRKTSAVTRYLYAKLANVERVGGTMYASTSFSVPKLASYTVSYNANGGSGAPSSQTKWYGTAITLSSTKPTKTGHTFQGWATSASGSVSYAAGASYASNASVTLYAVWKANTYTVKYSANGGSGAPSSQTKTYGVDLTLSSTKPTRTNYTFQGWGKSASATTVAYAAGAKYTANAAITLYAVWSLAYTKPRITSVSVARCDSDGTINDSGTNVLAKFSWACDKTVSSVKIEWKLASASSWSSTTVSASGTSGSVSKVVGSNGLSTESTYSIRITVNDGTDSTTVTKTVTGILYPIDVKNKGNGIAFGKPAELAGYADIAYKVRLRDNMIIANGCAVYGRNAADDASLSMIYVNSNNNTVIGYGGYSNNLGTTNIYGNEVRFTSRTGVFADGCRVAKNKVLWSGAYYMMDTQTCTLDEKVSDQANGIVLVWSWYSTSESSAENQNFHHMFIPKQHVSDHDGKGCTMFLTGATGSTAAIKYVYVSNTTVTGYSNNNVAEYTSASGLTLTPKNFVLRYVIGV